MSGLVQINWVELEAPVTTSSTALYLLQLKNDFQEVWVKNVRLTILEIRNPAGQPCKESITAEVTGAGSDYLMPQGVLACHVRIHTKNCPPGKYQPTIKVEYDIATEKMGLPARLHPTVEVIPS